MERYDLAVVGSGMGGFAAAIESSALGAKTVLIEKRILGGTCVNEGCIPTKALLWAGELMTYARDSERYGFRVGEVAVDFPGLMAMQRSVVEAYRSSMQQAIDDSANLTFIHGETSFLSPTELRVGEIGLTAEKTILAVGSQALVPPIDGLRETGFLTNREVLQLRELPQSLIVVGGGPVAVEFAQMFRRFGSRVTLLQRGDRILPFAEPMASQMIMEALEEEGVDIFLGADVARAQRVDSHRAVVARFGEAEEMFEADEILVATGRAPELKTLNLGAAGIEVERNRVTNSHELKTTADNVWLLGDVTGGPQFAHYATDTARIAVHNAILEKHEKVPEGIIPGAVFTSPELAMVGMTQVECEAAGHEINVVVHPLEGTPRARLSQQTKGFIKLIADAKTDKILGLHIVGFHAGDMLHEGLAVINMGGTVHDIMRITHVHPTMPESMKAAVDRMLGTTSSTVRA